jgi:2-keto-3-deoxy-6-phosphogluconate aldolase
LLFKFFAGGDIMEKDFEKGEYEEAVERAKGMIEAGVPTLEIMDKTGLGEDDIRKIVKKREREGMY